MREHLYTKANLMELPMRVCGWESSLFLPEPGEWMSWEHQCPPPLHKPRLVHGSQTAQHTGPGDTPPENPQASPLSTLLPREIVCDSLGSQDVSVMIGSSLLRMPQWSAWDKESDWRGGQALTQFPSLLSEEVWVLIKGACSLSQLLFFVRMGGWLNLQAT